MISENLIVLETGCWTVSLFPNQCYLGRVQITLRRDCEGWLVDLTPPEWHDLRTVFERVQRVEDRLFAPDRFNLKQLGNQWHQVHVHLIPRYETPRTWAGVTFTDARWGDDPYPEAASPLDAPATQELADFLRSAFIAA